LTLSRSRLVSTTTSHPSHISPLLVRLLLAYTQHTPPRQHTLTPAVRSAVHTARPQQPQHVPSSFAMNNSVSHPTFHASSSTSHYDESLFAPSPVVSEGDDYQLPFEHRIHPSSLVPCGEHSSSLLELVRTQVTPEMICKSSPCAFLRALGLCEKCESRIGTKQARPVPRPTRVLSI
jgi:hypothetical protein